VTGDSDRGGVSGGAVVSGGGGVAGAGTGVVAAFRWLGSLFSGAGPAAAICTTDVCGQPGSSLIRLNPRPVISGGTMPALSQLADVNPR